MNTAEYIASGILEQYVAGSVSSQEKQEVECLSHIYPEIKRELESLQQALELYAKAEQKAPPAFLRDAILEAIKTETVKPTNTPATTVIESKQEEHTAPAMKLAFKRMQIAAAVLALLTIGLLLFLLNNRSKQKALEENMLALQQQLDTQHKTIDNQNAFLAVVRNKEFKQVVLQGIPAKSPTSSVTVYWNKNTQDVYLNVQNLPETASDKQYQLWAIADGKPVDMGMIELDRATDVLQKMKAIGSAQAFAITLEKKGGVASPTLTEMYVMGGI